MQRAILLKYLFPECGYSTTAGKRCGMKARETGDYAKTHEQFRDRKMTCEEVIDYIAEHDKWRAHNPFEG